MKFNNRYSVVFNDDISDYRENFTTYLYNSPEFIMLKEGYQPVYCQLLDHREKKILVRAVFLCDGDTAVSLPQTPFGGIFYHHVSIDGVKSFILELIKYFTSRHFKKIVIKNPADIYNPGQNAILTNCLVNAGFLITNYDINHHIKVDQSGFSAKIHKMENRKLNASIKQNFSFQEITGSKIVEVYNFIRACRHEKKVNMNITFDQLNKAVKKFPERYKFFMAVSQGKIAAATVAVFVHDSILYNYLPASPVVYNRLSPMVFLLEGLYKYCQAKSVKILDLGISTLNNKPQESLILFKERVGGEATLKLTFMLDCF
ncbi:MAG: hypothetical protein MI921_07475 [Cytophagales bacterium]|nr:hypothetical protein [Cytophagales bacterium]